ncbi:MAG: hypothetical protein GX595_19380 [Lentisphaerae bacterium]|nr:hypothetical protein [Lentisphaerota bacterium]
MTHRLLVALVLVLGSAGRAWIDYDDVVVRKDPVFGKDFRSLALRLSTAAADFEQDSGQEVLIELRQSGTAAVLPADEAERQSGLLVVLTDQKGGLMMVSQDLLEAVEGDLLQPGKAPPAGAAVLCRVSFDALKFSRFEAFENGLPKVAPDAAPVASHALVPQIYVLRAILYSAPAGRRPDLALASEAWPILLRPKPGARMAADEREAKMRRWLAKMGEGAYGGIGVSSQLAALGDVAVDPLIAMADRDEPGKEAVRESRIWAIVTLCNTGSPRAEAYIRRRLADPVDFGDLAFLAWHSQALRSPEVTALLVRLAEDAACDRAMPWEATRGAETRHHGRGMLEYAFRHLASVGASITDPTAAALVALNQEKLLSFGLLAWRPASPERALETLQPLWVRGPVHNNLKKAVLACLAQAAGGAGFPAYDREGDILAQWLAASLWLRQAGRLDDASLTAALRWLVLDVPREAEAFQADLVAALARCAGDAFPVQAPPVRLPRDWVATWRWALAGAGLPPAAAIRYCTTQMRTRDELPDEVRLGLLLELRRLIGAEFPLPAGEVDLETAWPTCGQWLVDQGYFSKKDN